MTGAADKRDVHLGQVERRAFEEHAHPISETVRCLDASASARLLVTGSAGCEITMWNVEYVETKQRRKFDDENPNREAAILL